MSFRFPNLIYCLSKSRLQVIPELASNIMQQLLNILCGKYPPAILIIQYIFHAGFFSNNHGLDTLLACLLSNREQIFWLFKHSQLLLRWCYFTTETKIQAIIHSKEKHSILTSKFTKHKLLTHQNVKYMYYHSNLASLMPSDIYVLGWELFLVHTKFPNTK